MPTLRVDPVNGRNLPDLKERVNGDLDVRKFALDILNPAKGERDFDVAEVILDGVIERTMEGASTLSVDLHDPEGLLLRSGAFDSKIDVRFDGLWWRLVAVNKNDSTLTLIFEDRDVAFLRGHKEVVRFSRGQMTRLEFCAGLVKRVKRKKIPMIVPELTKRQPIAKQQRKDVKERRREAGIVNDGNLRVWYAANQDRPGVPGSDVAGPAYPGTKSFTSRKATNEQIENAETILDKGTEKKASRKALIGAIATAMVEASLRNKQGGADSDLDSVGIFQQRPSQGWGTPAKLRDISYAAGKFYDAFKAAEKKNPTADVGTLCQTVQGSAHPERYGQAAKYARAFVEAYGAAGGDVVSYRKRYVFTTLGSDGKPEDWWTAMGRLLDETNFARFMSNGVLYMISEKQLMKSKPRMRFHERSQGVKKINFDYDVGKKDGTATVECRATRWIAPPGTVVELARCGPASGKWLVASTRRSFFSRDMTIDLKQPEPTLPEPAAEVILREGVDEGLSTNRRMKKYDSAKKIVDHAVRIAIDAGGSGVWVASAYRAGDPLDHGANNELKAARDIAVKGIDAITGPPSRKLDLACKAILASFGEDYKLGTTVTNKENGKPYRDFEFNGFRIQVIWRTTAYGGHMGHIHIGARAMNNYNRQVGGGTAD